MGFFLVPHMMGMSMVMSPILVPQQNGPPMIINVPSYVYPPNMLNSACSSTSNTTPSVTSLPSVVSAAASNLLNVSQLVEAANVQQQQQRSRPPPPLVVETTPNLAPSTTNAAAVTNVVSSHIRDLEQDIVVNAEQPENLVQNNNANHPRLSSPIPSTSENVNTSATTTSENNLVNNNDNTKSSSSSPPSSSSNHQRFTDTLQDVEPRALLNQENLTSTDHSTAEKVCTVKTVNDLRNAQMLLKSNDDIQIVVANELLETAEFKDFMSHLNLPQQVQHQLQDNANHVPPNTPITTRPSSAVGIKINPDDDDDLDEVLSDHDVLISSPLPSTSRTVSHESSPLREEAGAASPIDDDDGISLQDLVAMETMEDEDDDDDELEEQKMNSGKRIHHHHGDTNDNIHVINDEEMTTTQSEQDDKTASAAEVDLFRLASCSVNTPLEPIVNAILRDRCDVASTTESFECDFCGLHFPTHDAYVIHKTEICSRRKSSKNGGNKVKKSSSVSSVLVHHQAGSTSGLPMAGGASLSSSSNFEGLAEIKSEVNSVLSTSDLQLATTSSAHAASVVAAAGGHQHFKIETLMVEQPALGALDGDDRNGGHWKCHECLTVFTSAQDLHRHQEEFKLAKFKCRPCHVIYDDRKSLLAHKRDFHNHHNVPTTTNHAIGDLTMAAGAPHPPPIPIIKVEKGIEELSSFLVPNENGDLTCRKCDRAFQDKELAIKHMSCHEDEKSFECLICGKKFARASLLRDHKKRHFSEGTNECHYCFKKFLSPNKLREHIRVHTGEAPLLCGVCGKGFKRHSNLSEHKRIHDENRPVKPPKELYCNCGQVFQTQRALDWHVEEIHERVPKKCNFCGEVFVHSTSLTRHIRLRHENSFMPDNKKASLSAKCPICSQMFYKTSINKHIRIKHQGLKPYVCEICKMGFVTKNNLDNHQYQHKGLRSRPFKCQLCRKAYVRQSQLDAHMRSHKGLKPFVCNECGLQFTNKSNWQRHVAEHSGIRNFKCPDCGKRFSRSYYLTDHMKTHSGEKPYSCAICGKTAATRSNYNSHLRTHITREPVNSEV